MTSFEVQGPTLRVVGELDNESESELKSVCQKLLAAEGDTVTLDLTLVEYVNSISIGILVALCMDLREAGKRAILQPSKAIKRVLDLTGLTETFTRAAKAIEKPKERTRSKKAQF